MDDFLREFFPKVLRRKQMHLKETDYCKYDNQILTLFTSSLYFAGLISTFAASYVTRNKGRRASIIVGSISFFLGAVLNAAAVNIAMLIFGRIFLGIGIGFGNQVSKDGFQNCFSNNENFKEFLCSLNSFLFKWCRPFLCTFRKWLLRKFVERLTNCFS